MKLHITTRFTGEDKGDGGIRRIVEAQRRYLPLLGVEVVDGVGDADLVCSHAGELPVVPVSKPWVVHCHGLYWDDYEWASWAYKLNRLVIEAMRQADAVTAPSEWVAYALERGMWLRPTVLQHGIDPDLWPQGTSRGYVLWNKTRVDPICDPKPLNDLAKMLPSVDFVSTFGDKQPNVTITGRLPFSKGREQVLNADVYLATTRETMGIGTLEAMAAGVPVLGYRYGGQAEFIRHKETGWLADPGDVKGLAEGYHWLRDHRAAVSAAARADCLDRFTWPVVMQRYAALYESMITKAREKRPKASVIITAYNLEAYLPAAIESVQKQTLKDIEIVVVDDHSPDQCGAIADKAAASDPRIKVVHNQANLYLAGALNAGIARSSGQYVLCLDADNMLPPTTLSTLASFLDSNRRVAIAYGRMKVVTDDGVSPDQNVSPDGVSGWPADFSFPRQIAHRNQIPSTCMYRREVWERVGGYRRRWRTAEDAAFWTQATSYGFRAAKATDAVTLIYRNRQDSMSHTNTEPDWTAWLPWAKKPSMMPFGAPIEWQGNDPSVPSYEPTAVTVIIPVGEGHEGLMIDALDSVEGQTVRGWQCIVINDTGKPLHVPHPWARVISTKGHEGPAIARNLGIAASITPFFVPLDADDIFEPMALEYFLSAVADENTVVYSQWYDDKGVEPVGVYDPPDYDREYLLRKGCLHAITALYPKRAWELVRGFDPTIVNWEDWDFEIALAKANVCGVKIAAPLWTYRKTTGTRRDEAVGNYERGKKEMTAKWGALFEGKERFMPCGGCGKTRRVNNNVPRGAQAPPVVAQQSTPANTLKVEYIGGAPTKNPHGISAPIQTYRFDRAGRKIRDVRVEDARHLVKAFPGMYRILDESKGAPASALR